MEKRCEEAGRNLAFADEDIDVILMVPSIDYYFLSYNLKSCRENNETKNFKAVGGFVLLSRYLRFRETSCQLMVKRDYNYKIIDIFTK